jgi:VanZ family protein
MKTIPVISGTTRLRRYLIAGYTLLIIYASLSPFTGWREQGLEFSAILAAPLGQTYTPFDAVTNLLAYLPFGLLLGLTLRTRFGAGWSVLLASLGGITLSAAMEYTQMYLPMRISSNFDLLTNSSGTLTGALLAANIAPSAWFTLLTHWRHRLLRPGGGVDFGLTLVALWMFAQVNPSLPMLGNIFISETARQPFAPPPIRPFNWLESMAVALNLLTLGGLLFTLLYKRRHAVTGLILILGAVALIKFISAALLMKSWALLLWLNSEAMLGTFSGLLLLIAATRLPSAWLHRSAIAAALGYLILAHEILDSGSPASTMRLYHWKVGHLLTYNGLSQTILLLFPLLLLGYLWHIRELWRTTV